jgi:hypothetical protein
MREAFLTGRKHGIEVGVTMPHAQSGQLTRVARA